MNLKQTLGAALVEATLCLAGSTPVQAFYRTVNGFFVGAGDGQIVVADDNARNPKVYRIDQTVRVTLNGRPAYLDELLPGDLVRVAIASGAKVQMVNASRPWR